MKALGGSLVFLVLIAGLGGCLSQAPSGNPNLRTPRLLVDWTPDHRTILYVHGAFSDDNLYDRMRIRIDNATSAKETYVYSITDKPAVRTFLVNVTVGIQSDEFAYQAHVTLHPAMGRVDVTPWTAQGPGRPGNHTLPYQVIVPLVTKGAS